MGSGESGPKQGKRAAAVPGAENLRGQNPKFRGQRKLYATVTYVHVPGVPGVPGAKRNVWMLMRGTSGRRGGLN